jgi:hypothetical protein
LQRFRRVEAALLPDDVDVRLLLDPPPGSGATGAAAAVSRVVSWRGRAEHVHVTLEAAVRGVHRRSFGRAQRFRLLGGAVVNLPRDWDRSAPCPLGAHLASRKDVCGGCTGCSGGLLPPSPPAEKATARQDQAGQAGTDNGTGDGDARERKARVKRWRRSGKVNDVGDLVSDLYR